MSSSAPSGLVPREGLVTLAHVIYGLHAFSAVMGLLTPAMIVTAFITVVGIPIALVVWFATGIWVLYRIIRGWLALTSQRPLP